MNGKDFFYLIDGFSPSKVSCGMDFGFSANLDIELVKKADQIKLSSKRFDQFQSIAQSIIIDSGLAEQGEMIRKPYIFIRGEDDLSTNLLHYCTVPGNSCDIGLDINKISDLKKDSYFEKFISYTPHNVDNSKQAYALLSIWLYWANTLRYIK